MTGKILTELNAATCDGGSGSISAEFNHYDNYLHCQDADTGTLL